jgi:hypothetical protein
MRTVAALSWVAFCIATLWVCAYFASLAFWCLVPALLTGAIVLALTINSLADYVKE